MLAEHRPVELRQTYEEALALRQRPAIQAMLQATLGTYEE